MGYYKGSGSPVFYTTLPMLTSLLLTRDQFNHRLWKSPAELASELGPLQASAGLPSHRTVQLEPLKPVQALQVESVDSHWVHEIRDLRDDVMPRILRIEQKLYQHDKAINRALDIAVKHLPSLKA